MLYRFITMTHALSLQMQAPKVLFEESDMIYTVTFNPALDYIVSVDRFELGRTNRTTEECMLPGGKGINVSTVLKNLGITSTALGFTAGFTGEELERRVRDLGIVSDFIRLGSGATRINVKLRDYDGTEINGMGPRIDEAAMEKLWEKLSFLGDGDTLVLSGSIPSGMTKTIYSDIMRELSGKKIRFTVDAASALLLNVLPYHPFLIKPNHHELEELFCDTTGNDISEGEAMPAEGLTTRESVIPYAARLQEMGARNVLVSMGGKGAVLLDENGGVHMHEAPAGQLVNAVGAGDSMVAGFLTGYEEKNGGAGRDDAASYEDYEHAFRMGIAAGSASAFSERLGEKEEILALYKAL